METLEDAFERERALVIGLGGGGDIVGAVPTARLLERHGVETLLGGVAWEPAPADPTVGPTGFDDIHTIERVSETVAWASEDTRTTDGVVFAETGVARATGNRTLLVDLTAGLDGMIDGIEAACERLDIDLVVGTDSGGDALARGDEPGLRSPVTDGLGLATLEALSVPTMLGVFGYGSDGELTRDEPASPAPQTGVDCSVHGGSPAESRTNWTTSSRPSGPKPAGCPSRPSAAVVASGPSVAARSRSTWLRRPP